MSDLLNRDDRTLAEIARGVFAWFAADIAEWCVGRSWAVRVPLWLFLAYVGVKQAADPMYPSLFGGINLGIHEGGHLLFRFAGEFICVAGGTILQLAAPLGSMFMFLKQRDYFAIAVCFGWLSTNLVNIGVYMSDALALALPLVTVGDSGGIVKHDWRYLFSKLGVLNQCGAIGWMTIQLGNLSMLFCLASGAWLMWKMFSSPKKSALRAG